MQVALSFIAVVLISGYYFLIGPKENKKSSAPLETPTVTLSPTGLPTSSPSSQTFQENPTPTITQSPKPFIKRREFEDD
jgi:hypothetical protein